MSKKIKIYCNTWLHKKINENSVHLYKGYDLVHGKGWFCTIMNKNFNISFGFHKKNKFTAYRNALINLKNKYYE